MLRGICRWSARRTLLQPVLHYAVYGRLNAARDNAVLVCHALSGSALAGELVAGVVWGRQRIGNREQGLGRTETRERRTESREQRTESRERRTESREQRTESRERENREQRARNRTGNREQRTGNGGLGDWLGSG